MEWNRIWEVTLRVWWTTFLGKIRGSYQRCKSYFSLNNGPIPDSMLIIVKFFWIKEPLYVSVLKKRYFCFWNQTDIEKQLTPIIYG